MKNREAYYDNAKFFLIFFVVFGHLIQSYIHEDKFIYSIYTTLYTFHMPAFILISGFFAKGFYQKGYLKKITKKLIIPYLIFQAIYSLYYYFLIDQSVTAMNPLDPQWSLWFLMSLFCWNVMLFVFAKWSPVISLSIAVAIGIAVGYFNEISNFLSLSRTFVFFPFFLLGYYLKKEHFEKVKHIKFRYLSFGILLTIFLVVYIAPTFEYRWLFGSKPYDVVNEYEINGGFIRLGVYVVALLATLSFLALVPRRRYFFTKWGTGSIYVYLLHGFFVKYFRNSQFEEVLSESEQIIVLIFLSLILTGILSSKWIRKIAQPLIELKLDFSKKYAVDGGSKQRRV
ncbi:putative membrane-bound acyltransferase YkrP [Robertmurraya siralis]|uniref:Membrane-bound acyltransferase YkrP n=1 Tax=Robertmurraya siralis TaxID=77777 RepID=A0A919WHB9_9BACI|nr:acyltransferase family protein [Robertmurraya siralis]PAE21585.1 acyltransferase [Bacillus sp. 7504-2]GIN61757.1 putative membrane-bound acyltransferase YkrP [Robertmurraya siralis]